MNEFSFTVDAYGAFRACEQSDLLRDNADFLFDTYASRGYRVFMYESNQLIAQSLTTRPD